MSDAKNIDTYIWVDLEMTGLNIEQDVILEIATIITDVQLNVRAQGPHLIIHHEEAVLKKMNSWCTEQHTKSGLLAQVRSSTITAAQAEQETFAFIKQHCAPQKGILCGNSVWQDRNFLHKHMPSITNYLHYKLIDVSSVQQLIRHWYPKNPLVEFKKKDSHRALTDIEESIAELRHYRTNFFVS